MSQQPKTQSHADPITINEFLNSLQRLFKIGIYYPSGHAILDKATDRFMRHLATVAGDNPVVTLQDYKDSLMIEDVVVDSGLAFVQEFKTMLSLLGITSLDIQREITGQELHVFVQKMLAFRSKVQTAKQFTQIEVTELPASITVRFKEFIARKDASISDEQAGDSAENLDNFIESLSQYGLSGEEIGQCKTLLESLPGRLTESKVDLGDLPYASWDDVARLLARAVKSGQDTSTDLRDRVSTHSNINALASILKKLEQETPDKKSRESINLLVSIIKKPFKEAEDEVLASGVMVGRTFPDKPHFSVAQLQGFTTKNKLHLKILNNLPETPAAQETLSILLQIAQYEQTLQTQIRVQQLYREILSGELPDKVWQILSGGLHHVIKNGSETRISSTIRLIIEPLRRSRHASTLRLFVSTALLCSKKEAKIIWPFAVNEILVCGSSADLESYKKLCQITASFPPEDMLECLPKLQNLDAFESNAIAPDIFHDLSPQSYSLFAFLLKTEIGQFVGDRVLGGFRRHPGNWLIKAIVPLLDLSQQEHKLFIYSYLRQASSKSLPAAIKTVAARIIAASLAELPQDRRSESWVVNTISALAQLQTQDTRDLLSQIAKEKKLLFIPEWPTECRKAADAALASGKTRR